MRKKTAARWLLAALCLVMALPAAAEKRQAVISLEGMEETIEETLYESPQGFSFWYPEETLKAAEGERRTIKGTVVSARYMDDGMVLSVISEEDAAEYLRDSGEDIREASRTSRVQRDVYHVLENGTYLFLTVIAENGQYLSAVGEYSQESAEGNGKYLQRVLDSVTFLPEYDAEFLRELPGEWADEQEGTGTVLTLAEDGTASLYCYEVNGGSSCTCRGSWSYQPVPGYCGRLTLRFTATDRPDRAGSGYSVECAYNAYTESWVENDTLITCLLLEPPEEGNSGSPFEEAYGFDGAALRREQGPNMKVVKCSSYVSLRESRSTSSKRLAKVPLGAMVLAFPEAGDGNGFLYCVYHGTEGFILAEYLQPAE